MAEQIPIAVAQPISNAMPIEARNVQAEPLDQKMMQTAVPAVQDQYNLKKKALYLLMKQLLGPTTQQPQEADDTMVPPIEPYDLGPDNIIHSEPPARDLLDVPDSSSPYPILQNASYQEPDTVNIGPNQKIPSTITDATSPSPEAMAYLYVDGKRLFNFMPELFNIREQY